MFAVADDDQIIYQWAGASYRQIAAFREHFVSELFQLVENRRCPPEVVRVANNLVTHNAERTPGKAALLATRPDQGPAISQRVFATDDDEAAGIANEIANTDPAKWGETAVLARTRAILQPVLNALLANSVKAFIVTRRDRFISPQFVWLQSCLDQSLRPADRQVFTAMADAANRIAGAELDAGLLAAEAEASGNSYMEYWALAANASGNTIASRLGDFALRIVQSRAAWRAVTAEALAWLPETAAAQNGVVTDAADDKAAGRPPPAP